MLKSLITKILATILVIGLFSPMVVPVQTSATTAASASTAITTATTASTSSATQTVLGEVSTFGEFISLIWSYGSQVIIALAVFFIILGAFFYVSSAGNEERVGQGKQMIFGSLIAILIIIFSGVLIRTLHKPAEGSSGYLTDVPSVIYNATNILVGIIGAFTVFMFVYAGIMYILARGDTAKISKAHAALRYAVFGLAIGVLAYVIVNNVVNYFL